MATKVIVLCTNRGEREDGSVDYSDYLLVSSDTLNFDEPVFGDSWFKSKLFFANEEAGKAYDSKKDPNGWNAPSVSKSKFIDHLRGLGYTVEGAGVEVFWASSYSETGEHDYIEGDEEE